MVGTLVLIYFVLPRLAHTIETNFVKFPTFDPDRLKDQGLASVL